MVTACSSQAMARSQRLHVKQTSRAFIEGIGATQVSEVGMSEDYVKLVALLKIKPGISCEEFQEYYENKHSKLIRLLPRVQRYFRRYLRPVDGLSSAFSVDEAAFSVITELWFKNREDLDFALRRNADPEVAKILAEDEEHLFDRSKAQLYIVEERFSDLSIDTPAAG
jgi:hypothetical protein